jgi:hypothetical protein
MDTTKRATVYFAPDVHKALRLRAAATDQTLSEMVNEAVRMVLAEDATDLEAFRSRKNEKTVSFESFVSGLKRSGRL